MKLAALKVSWGKSPSLDVVQYNVLVINEDSQEVLVDRVVSHAETEVMLEVLENTNITATVVANDGTFDSDPVSVSYSVGDLAKPEPATFVVVEVVSVSDVPAA